jgi:hypothetical protein
MQADSISLAQLLSATFSGVTLVVVVTVAWKLSALLAKMEARLEALKSIPARLAAVEDQLMALEMDINNLWAVQRSGEPEQTRRALWRPARGGE